MLLLRASCYGALVMMCGFMYVLSMRSNGTAVMEDESVSSSSSSSGARNRRRKAHHISIVEESMQQDDIVWNAERALIMASGSEFRRFSFELVESRWFSIAILLVILINTIFIGIQTSEYVVAKAEWYLTLVDQLFLAIYIIELTLKIFVWRLKFFKSSWNVFDFAIVMASVVDFLIPLIVQNIGVFDTRVFNVLKVFRALKALRALRVIRTIRFLKNLQIIVSTVLQSIPAMGSIIILISLVLYIFAVIGRGLYGQVDPGRFGNIAQACFTLFQLMTLDDWFYMYSDIRDNYPEHQHILVYLLLFILCETFIFINLFVAVIVDNLARAQAAANYNRSRPTERPPDHDSDVEIVVHNRKDRTVKLNEGDKQDTVSLSHFYTTGTLPDSDRELLSKYLLLVNSLEHHWATSRSHQRTLNELVDLADFSKT